MNRTTGYDLNATALARYDTACRAIAEARSVDEVRDIRDVAIAMQAYARQAKNRDMEADAIEIRLRATRRLDQLRQAQKDTVGLATGGEHGGRAGIDGLRKNPSNARPTLASQGIDKNVAHQGRVLGAMDDNAFERKVAEARDSVARVFRRVVHDAEIDQARQRFSKSTEHGCTVDDLAALAESGKQFGLIYADPPLRFDAWSGPARPSRSPDAYYKTESVDEIMRLPVAALAAKDCALVLWCTGPHVAIGSHVKIIETWGFRLSTILFVWNKTYPSGQPFKGEGHWTRSGTEFCVLGVKGQPLRLARNVPQVVTAPVGKHSEKPQEVRRRIERLFPGPYLELYGRKEFDGWTVWGNELASPLKAPAVLRPEQDAEDAA